MNEYDPTNRNAGGSVGPHRITITMEIADGSSVTVTREVKTQHGDAPEYARRRMVRMIDGLIATLGGWGLES